MNFVTVQYVLKMIMVYFLLFKCVHTQFYVKTHKSIPRIGRRVDPSFSTRPKYSAVSAISNILEKLVDVDDDGIISEEEIGFAQGLNNYGSYSTNDEDIIPDPPQYMRRRIKFLPNYRIKKA